MDQIFARWSRGMAVKDKEPRLRPCPSEVRSSGSCPRAVADLVPKPGKQLWVRLEPIYPTPGSLCPRTLGV